jgi:hypothetical protein
VVVVVRPYRGLEACILGDCCHDLGVTAKDSESTMYDQLPFLIPCSTWVPKNKLRSKIPEILTGPGMQNIQRIKNVFVIISENITWGRGVGGTSLPWVNADRLLSLSS